MFINFNEHFKVNPPKYIELETLLSNLHPETMFCCEKHIHVVSLNIKGPSLTLGKKLSCDLGF